MKSFLGFLFVMIAPLLLGGLFPVLLHEVFHVSEGWSISGFLIYTVIWFAIWGGPLDGGRKIPL